MSSTSWYRKRCNVYIRNPTIPEGVIYIPLSPPLYFLFKSPLAGTDKQGRNCAFDRYFHTAGYEACLNLIHATSFLSFPLSTYQAGSSKSKGIKELLQG